MTKPYAVMVNFGFDGQSNFEEMGRRSQKPYSFKCTVPDIAVGDICIVKCSTGYQAVKVIRVGGAVPPEATAHIVSKLDLEGIEKQIAAADAYEELSDKIEARIKEAAKERELKKLAKSDSVLAKLLAERDSL